jgi:hypothetical protein
MFQSEPFANGSDSQMLLEAHIDIEKEMVTVDEKYFTMATPSR